VSDTKFNPWRYSQEDLIRICQNSHFVRYSNGDATRLIRLTEHVVIKFGFSVTHREQLTKSISGRTRILKFFCVPRVYRFFTDLLKGDALLERYLVIEYVHSQELATYLKDPTITQRTIDSLVHLVATAVTHLSDLPKPDNQTPSPVSGGITYGFLWSDCDAGTTFKSSAVMCHTDLAPRNIIVPKTGGICFLDWADAGFYPYLFQLHAVRQGC
jgi:hypothetical protein